MSIFGALLKQYNSLVVALQLLIDENACDDCKGRFNSECAQTRNTKNYGFVVLQRGEIF